MEILLWMSLVLLVTLVFVRYERTENEKGFDFRPLNEIGFKLGLGFLSVFISYFSYLMALLWFSQRTGDLGLSFTPVLYIGPPLIVSMLVIELRHHVGAMAVTYVVPLAAVFYAKTFEEFALMVEYGYIALGTIWAILFLVFESMMADSQAVTEQKLQDIEKSRPAEQEQ